MYLKGLTYKQFSMIREAMLEKREKIWQEKYGWRAKNVPIKELREAKKRFDEIMNQWCEEGICNSILKEIDKIEEEAQTALKQGSVGAKKQ